MKTALILGINGNFGSQMALALRAKGYQLKTLIRDRAKAPTWLENKNIFIGDGTDKEKILRAAKGVDLIVYALNPPYQSWSSDALPLLEASVTVAEELGIRLLFPGNVYNFEPTTLLIDEEHEMKPITEKGAIRVAMEKRLREASRLGAQITIVRAGDFIGPNAHKTWMDMLLKIKGNYLKVLFPHDEKHVHFWSYLPDVCANTVQLLDRTQGDFEVWHDTGFALRKADWKLAFEANNQKVKFAHFQWWILQLVAPVVPLLKEVVKMKYLWEQPVILDGQKMKNALGDDYKTTELPLIIDKVLASK